MAQLDTQGISEDVQHITGQLSSRRIFLDRSQGLKPTLKVYLLENLHATLDSQDTKNNFA